MVALLAGFGRRSPEQAALVINGIERYTVELHHQSLMPVIAAIVALPDPLPAQTERWVKLWQTLRGPADELASVLSSAIASDPDGRKAKRLRAIASSLGILLSVPAETKTAKTKTAKAKTAKTKTVDSKRKK